MGEYFKPARRKGGVVTLGLACVVTVIWFRSLAVSDMYWSWPDQGGQVLSGHVWYSSLGNFIWRSEYHQNPLTPATINPGRWVQYRGPKRPDIYEHFTSVGEKWSRSLYVMSIRKTELFNVTTYWLTVHYGPIAGILTLLSAILLLWPQRHPKPSPD